MKISDNVELSAVRGNSLKPTPSMPYRAFAV